MKQKFAVTGMTCAACSGHVEKAVQSVDGVTEVAVSLLTNSMQVTFDSPASEAAICAAVSDAGYGASVFDQSGQGAKGKTGSELEDQETPLVKKRLIASICILIPLMYVSMGHMAGFPMPMFLMHNSLLSGIYQLVLSGLVMVINQKFFISGVKGVLKKAPNMDTLVALGAGASFIYSIGAMFSVCIEAYESNTGIADIHVSEYYFESAAMILTLITVGKMLEAYSKGKTTDAIKGLMELAPQSAVLIRDGEEVTVSIEEVRTGDIFVVRPGENIPVDGRVVEGSSAINEAALTGESLPVDKEAGSEVSSGTMNISGFLKCEATRVGEDTTINQIIRMVEDASATKAPIAKIADKVSGVFVPIVVIIAVITGAVWLAVGKMLGFAVARAISVLVISCPCALGLATPVAIMVGTGKGAKSGVLYKTATSLEQAGRVQYVVLDKTGTVTKGHPAVTDILTAEGVTKEELLRIAGTIEKKSEHPLAIAIVEYLEQNQISSGDAGDFEALPGAGIHAVYEGRNIYGGNLRLMREHKINLGQMEKDGERFATEGKTPLYFAAENKLLGMIAVADVIKEDSKKAIEELEGMGLQVILLTGDNEKTARAIAAQAGIKQVISDVLPDQKEAQIRRLSEKGLTAMVGDGINDAPALTRADVGIAIGAGSDIAIDAADVVLMKSSLMDVAVAIRLSRQVIRNIHENLFWAFIYNVLGIPLAAGVWYIFNENLLLNPMFGAAAMSLSSVCVVTNALRLNLFNVHSTAKDGKYKKKNLVQNTDLQNTDLIESEPLAAAEVAEEGEKTMTKTLIVDGMVCQMCVKHVKKALEAIENVTAEVDLESKTVTVNCPEGTPDEVLVKAVTDAEYEVKEIR